MKLTADLINSSPSYINTLKDRELSLRGHRIPLLENLGASKDLNDTIDLTDNDLTHLTNLPRLPRLRRLLLARNRIAHIAPPPALANAVPNLTTLVLTSNTIGSLDEIDNLSELKKLAYLTLIDNPVTRKENYRLYVIAKVPSVRILDFQKVKQSEREEARSLYGGHDEEEDGSGEEDEDMS
ncbi:leucine-rich repeat-domain-containing protein [Limtongia smithiae]|uniref:leucine-rich repeat-domain-containing protein n=1 Tax=Limtongia smithiae TaxID=1125753 RepID=UPI0034CEE11E